MAHSATEAHRDDLLAISSDRRYKRTRQTVVGRLDQFKDSPRVLATLLDLIEDHDVGLFAMHSLTAILSPAEALPHIERVERRHPDTLLGRQAAQKAWGLRQRLAGR